MKAHPGPAMLHVRLERGALGGIVGARIQKYHDLIRGEKVGLEVVPIGCGIEGEMVSRRHFRKPAPGFSDEADMGRIFLGRVERDDFEGWRCVAMEDCEDRKSTRLNSSHLVISYAVFC